MSTKYMRWQEFVNACESQWRVAGNKRFAYNKEKEWSDVITDILGNSWIGGQILKYAGEIYNTKRSDGIVPEVCFFKIAVYSYIWWLKEFRQKYTGPELKEKYWPEFVEQVKLYDEAGFAFKSVVTKDEFVARIKYLVTGDDTIREDMFFILVVRAYHWWLQEMDHFTDTDRDEGEEFKK